LLKCRPGCIRIRLVPATSRKKRIQAIILRNLGSSRFARRYLGNTIPVSLPQGTEMVHFPWYRSPKNSGYSAIKRSGLPHSEISGSKSVCDSPEHIAAYHVLHRLLVPSHPPKALCSLTTKIGYLYLPDYTSIYIVKDLIATHRPNKTVSL
jgi:hypothetical protein